MCTFKSVGRDSGKGREKLMSEISYARYCVCVFSVCSNFRFVCNYELDMFESSVNVLCV